MSSSGRQSADMMRYAVSRLNETRDKNMESTKKKFGTIAFGFCRIIAFFRQLKEQAEPEMEFIFSFDVGNIIFLFCIRRGICPEVGQ